MANTAYDITSGFYDSVDGDRKYFADQMNMPYKRIVSEGIFGTDNTSQKGTDFNPVITNSTDRTFTIASGMGILNGRWFEMVTTQLFTADVNNTLSDRKDSIIIAVDTATSGRKATIEYRLGTGGTPPTLVNNAGHQELRICNVIVKSLSTGGGITIEDTRGTNECPIIVGLLKELSVDDFLTQFKNTFNEFQSTFETFEDTFESFESSYTSWYSGVQNDWNTIKSTFEGIESDFAEIQSTWSSFYSNAQSQWTTFKSEKDSDWTTFKNSKDSDWTSYKNTKNTDWTSFKSGKDSDWTTYKNGKTSEWNTWFNATKEDWQEFLAQATSSFSIQLIKQHVDYTSGTITITGYNNTKDQVVVYINGLYASVEDDYTLSTSGVITFKNTINSGAVIDIVSYRTVIG